MGLLKAASVLLALASTATSIPTWGNPFNSQDIYKNSVVESLSAPPRGWVKDETKYVDKDDAKIRLRMHLVNQDMDKFYELALSIATPGHHKYGSHMSQKAIDAIIAPRDESGEMVMSWLESAGLRDQATFSARGDSVIIETSVAQIEKLLDAKYEAFVNTETQESVLRTLEFSLPSVLKGHVDTVQPTTFFGFRAYKSSISAVRPLDESTIAAKVEAEAAASVGAVKGCSSYVDPTCLSNLYSFSSAKDYTSGKMGIGGFLEQYAIKSDLVTFMDKYAVESNTDESFTCVTVNDGECPSSASEAGDEANLDVQYARSITESIPLTYYSTGGLGEFEGSGTNTNEPYVEFLEYLLDLDDSDLPNTLSISYGDDEQTVPDDYAVQACDLFSQLGARGVSILVASGDSGVGSSGECTLDGESQFATAFPASCPWVTTVGGTTGQSPESAWTDSGGGFSYLFSQPSYQADAVKTWLATGTADSVSKYFNSSGRGYPDVSAQSTDFVIVVDGSSELVDGTSCATPTFASVIQLVNSDRIANGKSGLGFLNPWLYSNATSGLTDITSGSNSGCPRISGAGFDAVTGWDPVTGLGTPVFTSLLALSSDA
ncbi:Tripeptidyl-peptidase sed3 [Cytospora mali]|uniref:tripeptidyl-peptidase II n=1 Tax=Cytospora mali TaxID=578113 RepID=A0A194WBT0_CYTMA|nr:Tripeptidyl-peptidase sed3 [Valsa mali]